MVNRIGFATGALLLALARALWARAEFHLGSEPNTWKRFVVPDKLFTQDAAGNWSRESTANSPEETGGGTDTSNDKGPIPIVQPGG